MAQNTSRSMNEELILGCMASSVKPLTPDWSSNSTKDYARVRQACLSPDMYGTITDRINLLPFGAVDIPKGTQ